MSATDANSAIYVTDSAKEIKTKPFVEGLSNILNAQRVDFTTHLSIS